MEVTLDRQAAGVKNRTKSKNISRLLHMYFMSFVAVCTQPGYYNVNICVTFCHFFFLVVNFRKPKTQHIQLIFFFFYYLFELGMFVTFYMRPE